MGLLQQKSPSALAERRHLLCSKGMSTDPRCLSTQHNNGLHLPTIRVPCGRVASSWCPLGARHASCIRGWARGWGKIMYRDRSNVSILLPTGFVSLYR